jgi:hypothetical protein
LGEKIQQRFRGSSIQGGFLKGLERCELFVGIEKREREDTK